MIVKELGLATTTSSKPGKVIINTVNPGYCVSELQRHATPVLYFFIKLGGLLVARTTEVGSRTLFAGAVGGEGTHGEYMSDCKVRNASAFACSAEGLETQKKVYSQLLSLLDGIEPGIINNI
jgi:retinol dehydrogenase 12